MTRKNIGLHNMLHTYVTYVPVLPGKVQLEGKNTINLLKL